MKVKDTLILILMLSVLVTGCEHTLNETCSVSNDIEDAYIHIRVVSIRTVVNTPLECWAVVSNSGDDVIRIRRIRYGQRGAEITQDISPLQPGEQRLFGPEEHPCYSSFFVMSEQGNEIGFWNPYREIRQRIRSGL